MWQETPRTKNNNYIPGKNPVAYLWKETVITFDVKEKASSTPAIRKAYWLRRKHF